jgi:hypothetical protein
VHAHGVLVPVVIMNIMMMYISWVARFDENCCLVCILYEVVCTNLSIDETYVESSAIDCELVVQHCGPLLQLC